MGTKNISPTHIHVSLSITNELVIRLQNLENSNEWAVKSTILFFFFPPHIEIHQVSPNGLFELSVSLLKLFDVVSEVMNLRSKVVLSAT